MPFCACLQKNTATPTASSRHVPSAAITTHAAVLSSGVSASTSGTGVGSSAPAGRDVPRGGAGVCGTGCADTCGPEGDDDADADDVGAGVSVADVSGASGASVAGDPVAGSGADVPFAVFGVSGAGVSGAVSGARVTGTLVSGAGVSGVCGTGESDTGARVSSALGGDSVTGASNGYSCLRCRCQWRLWNR